MVPSQLNSLGFINPGLTLLLSVLSLSLSRLSSWRGFLPRRTWTHPLSPPLGVALLHLRFVFVFSYVVLGSTLPTPRSTPAWFCTSCCHFDGCFRLFVVFAISLLRRFLYPILDPLAFVPNTFYTHNLSKYGLFQSLSQYGLFQNPGLHTCFGLNIKPWFKQKQCFCVQTIFYTKSCFTWWRAEHAEGG